MIDTEFMNIIIMVYLPGKVLQYYMDMVDTKVMNLNIIIMVDLPGKVLHGHCGHGGHEH